MPETVVPAPAKINLALEVLGRRADGFHDIDSVVVPIDWQDQMSIVIEPTTDRSVTTLRVSGPLRDEVPQGAANLAYRAAERLSELTGCPLSVHVHLEKHIPVASGLGGGSANAAAVLAVARRWAVRQNLPFDPTDLASIAAELGSDVPALLPGGAVRVRGRGDQLEPMGMPVLDLVVAIPEASSTAATYGEVKGFSSGDRVARLVASLNAGQRLSDEDLGSDLEEPAGRANPALAIGLRGLREAFPDHGWHLTGSGGAAFALVDGREAAGDLANRVAEAGFRVRACRTHLAAPRV